MILKNLGVIPKYTAPSSWWQHVPIAHSLVELIKPEIIVELGSHYGVLSLALRGSGKVFTT